MTDSLEFGTPVTARHTSDTELEITGAVEPIGGARCENSGEGDFSRHGDNTHAGNLAVDEINWARVDITIEGGAETIQNKGMRRFTLRGQCKLSAQWKRFAMVHNIEKVARVAMGR